MKAHDEKGLKILIQQCQNGQQKAMKTLFNRYYRKMFAVVNRYVYNKEQVKDLLQDGFLKLFKNIDKVDLSRLSEFECWMKTIFINLSIDYLRKAQKMELSTRYDSDMMEQQTIDEAFNDAAANLEVDFLMEVIHDLPVGCKMVFNLYVIDGLKHEEIAEKLNIKVSSSRSQLTRARSLLKKKLPSRFQSVRNKPENK